MTLKGTALDDVVDKMVLIMKQNHVRPHVQKKKFTMPSGLVKCINLCYVWKYRGKPPIDGIKINVNHGLVKLTMKILPFKKNQGGIRIKISEIELVS